MRLSSIKLSRMLILLGMPRLHFLLPGAAPVFVGSALGYAIAGSFHPIPAILALFAMVAFNAGANMVNDYFDHLSGNDWLNKNFSPFSGGSGYIQKGIVSSRAMLLAGIISLSIGAALGLVIVFLTKSVFILILGIIGVIGGFFWTAPPVRWCYRCVGEPYIFTMFGLLPVYGAYYLQTNTIDFIPFFPAVIIGILIAMVAEINSFPDLQADAAVNKRTLVVRYGVPAGVWVYRISILATYVLALMAMFIYRWMFWPSLFFFFTLPIAVVAIKFANEKELTTPGLYRANKITIVLHSAAALMLTLGFVLAAL